jgi:hypothetical protein
MFSVASSNSHYFIFSIVILGVSHLRSNVSFPVSQFQDISRFPSPQAFIIPIYIQYSQQLINQLHHV